MRAFPVSATGLRNALRALAALVVFLAAAPVPAREFITIASTTSTEQSGLFRHLLPEFTRASGIEARVVAVGTGQALDLGRRGDADVVLVHDREAEGKFVAEGFGILHREVMYNDFVLLGPRPDPARAKGGDILEALRRIAAAQSGFASRADRSGTHAAELRLWSAAGIDLARARGAWYRELGSGMGPTLNTAAALEAYTLADRGTWISFRNRRGLAVLVENDPRLLNPYGVMLVNPARHAHVKKEAGMKFIDWLVSDAGQSAIARYRIEGEALFFPHRRP